jgi:hypothetical protein
LESPSEKVNEINADGYSVRTPVVDLRPGLLPLPTL